MNQIPEGKTEKLNNLLWLIWRTALGTQISLTPSPWMRCSWEWSVFVRKHSQCCWARCVHVAHQSTHSCPLPQLSWKNLVKTVHFLSLRTMLVTESDCRLRMENLFFPPLKRNTHSHRDPSEPFFWSKTSGKKIRRSSTRNDSSHENNNWPTENTNTRWERWAGWNTHWWWPQTWWNFFWKTPPLQCKITQRLISVLKQQPDEIGLSKCVLKATTIDKKLYAAVSLLPHDAAASPSCAKRKRWIYSNMTLRNDRCSDMRFSRKNALPNIRYIYIKT